MPPDAGHARSMFQVALRDLKALGGMNSDTETFDDAIFGFHAQQCCEKFFKAILSQLGQHYPHTHDLLLLWKQLNEIQAVPAQFESLVLLSPFAVQFRYESHWLSSSALDRDSIVECLDELKNWSAHQLGI